MIACVVAAAHPTINTGGGETLRQGRAEQKMIDAQAGIASERIPEILPERVDPLARVQRPQRIGPALLYKTAIGIPHLGAEQRVIDPALRRVDIEIGGHDVVIAGEHDRLTGRKQSSGMFHQPVEPAQLVIEFRSRRRIAVGQIQAPENRAVDRRLDVAAMGVGRIARHPRRISTGWASRARIATPFQLF